MYTANGALDFLVTALGYKTTCATSSSLSRMDWSTVSTLSMATQYYSAKSHDGRTRIERGVCPVAVSKYHAYMGTLDWSLLKQGRMPRPCIETMCVASSTTWVSTHTPKVIPSLSLLRDAAFNNQPMLFSSAASNKAQTNRILSELAGPWSTQAAKLDGPK